ncbi:alginate export family protein [uncultured Bradyrhizobium sp.]|nr:alginate export family protein [uncultured Bradyrhizobium sp.]
MRISRSGFAIGVSLLSLVTASGAAHAAPDASASPSAPAASPSPTSEASSTKPTAVASAAKTAQQANVDPNRSVPPAQRSTPPSEATEQRAPANPSVRTYPRQADGHGIMLGGYNASRWAEDWRVMRDPKKRKDILDRLKYIPIDDQGKIYITLSGEVRYRINDYSEPNLVKSGYRLEEQTRLVGGADVHIGPVRFYGELGHGGLSGYNYGVAPAKSRDALIAQQFFGEISGTIGNFGLGVRYGRQEFTDGPSNLVSQKDNNTIHTSVQGLRAWGQTGDVRADIFDFKQVTLGTQGLSDDVADDKTRFSGATFGLVLANSATRKVFLDPFAWRERNDSLKWGRVTGREVRNYYGARLWGSLDRLTLDWTVDHQSGTFAGHDISAWNAFIAQTYVIDPKHWKPKVGIHFDFGEGGGSYGSGTLHVAKAPFAGTIAYSYQGALNFTNLFQASPNLTVSPFKKLDLTTEYQHSWRVSPHDAIYRGAGTPYTGSETLPGNNVGDAIRLQATLKVTRRLSIVGRYEYFMPGPILDRLGYVDSHYLASWVSYRF